MDEIKKSNKFGKTTFEDKVRITILARQGKTYEAIGKEFGISRQRVHQIVKGYVAPSRGKKSYVDKLLDKFREDL